MFLANRQQSSTMNGGLHPRRKKGTPTPGGLTRRGGWRGWEGERGAGEGGKVRGGWRGWEGERGLERVGR